ncbi:MAG: hypothetical protein WC781_05375 [Candidatus Pacearchaeota archaeon]|jgi:hypothetical protein
MKSEVMPPEVISELKDETKVKVTYREKVNKPGTISKEELENNLNFMIHNPRKYHEQIKQYLDAHEKRFIEERDKIVVEAYRKIIDYNE